MSSVYHMMDLFLRLDIGTSNTFDEFSCAGISYHKQPCFELRLSQSVRLSLKRVGIDSESKIDSTFRVANAITVYLMAEDTIFRFAHANYQTHIIRFAIQFGESRNLGAAVEANDVNIIACSCKF